MLAGLIGAASHGLLDMCTSFGTSWYLPFSSTRDAWDLLSIIDPLFSLPLYLMVLGCLALKKTRLARVGAIWCLLYTAGAFVQHTRAAQVQQAIADSRGHTIERGRVMPTFGNTILWRSVYVHDGTLYADAIHIAPFSDPQVREGNEPLPLATADTLDPGVRDPERVKEVFEKFAHFTDGYLGMIPSQPGMLGDLRYSLDPSEHRPIWGIQIVEFSEFPTTTIDAVYWARGTRDNPDEARRSLKALFDRIFNPGPLYVTVDRLGEQVGQPEEEEDPS